MQPSFKAKLSPLPANATLLQGVFDEKIRLVTEGILKRVDMHALADYFRNTMDLFATGEFWGKLMRASCMACAYTGDPVLRSIIDAAASDMLSLQREDGCISTVPDEKQPFGTHGSDLWERKYVLIGLLAYHELTGSPKALDACVRLVRYTNAQVGFSPKTPITQTGWAFGGIESSSILQPLLQVYHLSGERAAMELAEHIVSVGCCDRENIFAAIRSGKSPMEIGDNGVPTQSIAKAYEMMSCFEGLCEYAVAANDPESLETVKIFWNKVMEEEITLLGSGGADAPFNLGPGIGEQWNRTRFEQTNPQIDLMMETCVTVYWMRLSYRLLCLTGETKYADALETSLYNAILGAIRPDGAFFEYFPRFNGARNPKVNYSFNIKGFDLSCCTANGPSGLCLAPALAVMRTEQGVAVNLYENARVLLPVSGGTVTFSLESAFPLRGQATLRVLSLDLAEESTSLPLTIDLRIPSYASAFTVQTKGKAPLRGQAGSYLRIADHVREGDAYEIAFDMPLLLHPAPHGSNRHGDNFVALTYGPLLLSRNAADCQDGQTPLSALSHSVLPAVKTPVEQFAIEPSVRGGFLTVRLDLGSSPLVLTDYRSAGADWQGSLFASWLPVE